VADFGDLGRILRVRAYQVGQWGDATPRKATKVLVSELIRATPVDEGVARSNWQVESGPTPVRKRPAFAPGRHLGLSETRNAAAAMAAAFAKIDRAPTVFQLDNFFEAGLMEAAGGVTFHVSNPVGYINPLDEGHSRQQPAGFVARAIMVARIAVRQNKIFTDAGSGKVPKTFAPYKFGFKQDSKFGGRR
jgi:hypothetical protein